MSAHKKRPLAGSPNGPYADSIASVLAQALTRLGRGRGSTGIFSASTVIGGADDGAVRSDIGERPSYPPRTALLELSEDERSVLDKIIAAMDEDPEEEPWSDLVVIIRIQGDGVAISVNRSPMSRLSEPGVVHTRDRYLSMPILERLNTLIAMVNSR